MLILDLPVYTKLCLKYFGNELIIVIIEWFCSHVSSYKIVTFILSFLAFFITGLNISYFLQRKGGIYAFFV